MTTARIEGAAAVCKGEPLGGIIFVGMVSHEDFFSPKGKRQLGNDLAIDYIMSFYRYVAEVLEYVYRHKKKVSGYKITWAPAVLRHFSAHLEPIPLSENKEELGRDDEEEIDEMEDFISRVRGMSFRRQSFQFL